MTNKIGMRKLFIKIGETIILVGVAAFMLPAYVLLILPEMPERARRGFSTKRKGIKQLKQDRKAPLYPQPVAGEQVLRSPVSWF